MDEILQDGDFTGAVRVLSSVDVLAEDSATTLLILRAKQTSVLPPNPVPVDGMIDVTTKKIYGVVKGFPSGFEGGFDALRPQHLKDLPVTLKNEPSNHLRLAVASIVVHMHRGGVPPEICSYLYGVKLIARTGRMDRPSAGQTLRHLAAEVVVHRVELPMGDLLRPHQMGFATPRSAEAIVPAVRAFVEKSQPRECRIF